MCKYARCVEVCVRELVGCGPRDGGVAAFFRFDVSNKNPSLHLDVLTWVRNLRVDDAECACMCACAIGDA